MKDKTIDFHKKAEKHRTDFVQTDLVTKTIRGMILSKLKSLEFGQLEVVEGVVSHLYGNCDPSGHPKAILNVLDPSFYLDIFAKGSIGAAEAYVAKKWDTPCLDSVMRIFALNRSALTQLDSGFVNLIKPVRFLEYWQQRNTVSGSKKNIQAHYDLPDDLFRLFLDESMMYSSAYFKEETLNLAQAQHEKLKLIAQRLKIRPGDRILEIGTGWGSLAVFLAQNYDCHVTTTTISENQFEVTRKKIEDLGLESKITLLKKDYRELSGEFDRVVSIEMIEAVGEQFLGNYLEKISDVLKADGLCLLQVITINDQEYDRAVKEVDFIKKYIFPGSFIPSIFAILEKAKVSTDLRLYLQDDMTDHYVKTLKFWKTNFNEKGQEISNIGLDEKFQRLWNFYFSYCIGGFSERAIGVSHLVFGKPLFR